MRIRKHFISFLMVIFGVTLLVSSVAWTNPVTISAASSIQNSQTPPANDPPQAQSWSGTVRKDDSGKLTLVTTDGKTFNLEPAEKVTAFVDKDVKVTGTLKGSTIMVASVEAS